MPPDEPTTTESDGRPAGLPDNFQTVEALVQSYQEVQREKDRILTESQREREAFANALEGFQQQPAPPQQQFGQAQAYDPAVSAFQAAWENGDSQAALEAMTQYRQEQLLGAVGQVVRDQLGAITPVIQQSQLAQREHDLRLAEGLVERQLGSDRYQELMPRVKEIIASDTNRWLPPGSSVESYAASIIDVAKLAEFDTIQRQNEDFARERQEKLDAQALTGGYNRQSASPDAARAEFERIKNTQTGSFEELMQRSRGAA